MYIIVINLNATVFFLEREVKDLFKYKNIEELYRLRDITKTNVISGDKKSLSSSIIFEVKDAVFLNIDENTSDFIFYNFKEFLTSINFEFKIIIRNEKLDIDKYIENMIKMVDDEIKNSEIFEEFIDETIENLKKENLYQKKVYIVIKSDVNEKGVENVENLLKKLVEIGCTVIRIDNERIKEVLFESMNKGVTYED